MELGYVNFSSVCVFHQQTNVNTGCLRLWGNYGGNRFENRSVSFIAIPVCALTRYFGENVFD